MEKSTIKYIEESIKKNWQINALTDLQGETITYQQMAEKIARLHVMFEKCGIVKDDKVALIGKNSSQWSTAFFAILVYGAVPVPLLHEFKRDAVHYLVNHSGSKLLFAEDGILKNLDVAEMPNLEGLFKLNDTTLIECRSESLKAAYENLDALYAEVYPNGLKPEDITYADAEADDLAIINYTSGSTGNPKGVMIPQRALASNVRFTHEHLTYLLPGDGIVCMLPLAHMYGLMVDLIHPISKGCHVHFLTRNLSPKVILDAFQEVKPKLIVTVPLILEKIIKGKVFPLLATPKISFMLKLPIIRNVVLQKIKGEIIKVFGGNVMQVIIGGAALYEEVDKFLTKIKFPFTVGYGMTECAPLLAYAPWDETKSGSCGRPVDRMQMKIDSVDPAKVAGELWVKGENVMLGYYNNEEATKEVMREDGWMNTGDLCNMDGDNFIFIRGRSKTMILGPSGQNIYPEEMEQVIGNAQYVVESLVIESNGKLVALVYPDFEAAKANGLEGDAFVKVMTENVLAKNKELPAYSKIAEVRIQQEEFEKTPKRSIKRFLYQDK